MLDGILLLNDIKLFHSTSLSCQTTEYLIGFSQDMHGNATDVSLQ